MARRQTSRFRFLAPFGALYQFGSLIGKQLTQRIIYLSCATGAVAGLVAVAFSYGLDFALHINFERLAGHDVLRPAGEISFFSVETLTTRPWVFFLLPIFGGLLSGFLVYTFAPEAEGHGTDAVIDAFHNKKGKIRKRVPFLKALASIITLSTGGSAGKEGPIAQVGAGIGSWVADLFHLSPRERRILLLAGISGGVGSIFRAPLGGALFGTECLYKRDFETDAVIPCIFSSVTAYSVLMVFFGTRPIFDIPPLAFTDWKALYFYILLAVVCVGVGALYVRIFYGMRDRVFAKIRIPNHFKPALGGLGVALVGLLLPQTLGGGYGYLQKALMGEIAIALAVAIALGKILTTSFTISSGGSGGVFAPSLFIGGMIGAAIGGFAHEMNPEMVPHVAPFVLVGMASFFAGIANAPISTLILVSEMTSGYSLLVPLMLVSGIALTLQSRYGLYEKQVQSRLKSPAHLSDFSIDVFLGLKVRDVFRSKKVVLIHEEDSVADIVETLKRTTDSYFPVVNQESELIGILDVQHFREFLLEPDYAQLLIAKDIMVSKVILTAEDDCQKALQTFLATGYGEIPVVESSKSTQVLGMLSHEDLTNAYEREMLRRRSST